MARWKWRRRNLRNQECVRFRTYNHSAVAFTQNAFRAVGETEWQPASRGMLSAWLLFYAIFLLYAFHNRGRFLFIDLANLVVHEGGHLLFGWFGPTLGLWGGTLLQWLVPFLLAAYFFVQRQIAGFAFGMFFFFENWLYTATYMADARAMALPLVTAGDSDSVCLVPRDDMPGYGTQSAMKMLVSCGTLPLRPETHTSFFPSGLNIGKPSKPSVKVIRSRFLPSRSTA